MALSMTPSVTVNRHWSVDVTVREGKWGADISHIPSGTTLSLEPRDDVETLMSDVAGEIASIGTDDDYAGQYDRT